MQNPQHFKRKNDAILQLVSSRYWHLLQIIGWYLLETPSRFGDPENSPWFRWKSDQVITGGTAGTWKSQRNERNGNHLEKPPIWRFTAVHVWVIWCWYTYVNMMWMFNDVSSTQYYWCDCFLGPERTCRLLAVTVTCTKRGGVGNVSRHALWVVTSGDAIHMS